MNLKNKTTFFLSCHFPAESHNKVHIWIYYLMSSQMFPPTQFLPHWSYSLPRTCFGLANVFTIFLTVYLFLLSCLLGTPPPKHLSPQTFPGQSLLHSCDPRLNCAHLSGKSGHTSLLAINHILLCESIFIFLALPCCCVLFNTFESSSLV